MISNLDKAKILVKALPFLMKNMYNKPFNDIILLINHIWGGLNVT